MAGRKMQYLVRRGNTYSFRRGIPARIQHIIDKGTHYVVSLGTADVSAAKRECLRIAAEVQSEFDRAFSQLPKPVAKVAAVDKALDVPGAVALVSDIIADRQHRDFHAALDNPAKAARFASTTAGIIRRAGC